MRWGGADHRFCVLACVLLLAGALYAQSTTQAIQGLVTDSSGAVIPGARVVITNLGTGVSRSVQTNETGNYTLTLVEVGNYDVRCELQGFKTEEVKNLRVETAGQVRQNFSLQPGQVTETVEVSASAVLLTTENATVGEVIENKRIIELPLNGRNVQNLAVLVAGVQLGTRTDDTRGTAAFPIPGAGFSVIANGQRETFQTVSLDGVDAKDPRIHITNFVPSIEALEEFKIQTNSYSAEVGFQGGAVVNMTMKSGTNSLHGTLFEFLRNDKLDARNYFLAPTAKKDRLRRNQFGLVMTGPLIRNKTFWAFDWEARHENSQSVQTAFFPPDSFRSGDFSALARGTINPATGKLYRAPIIVYDPFTGNPFQDNIIPQTRISPGAASVIKQFLPRADFVQTDPLDFTAQRGVNQPINSNQYFGRVDHYFNEKNRMFGRVAIDRSEFDNLTINPYFPVLTPSHVGNVAFQYVHTFNQNMINEFRFGTNISNDTLDDLHNTGNFDVDSLGIGQFRAINDGNRKLTPREQGVPILGFTMGDRVNGNGLDRMNTYQIGDHVSLIRGKHNLKMGAEVYKISMQRAGANQAQGSFTFSGTETGYDFASFLLGLPDVTLSPEGEPQTFPRQTYSGGYIHDDWKVGKRLTVNAGLRYDYVGQPRDAQGLWRTLDFVGEGADVGRGGGYKTASGQVISTIFPATVDTKGAVKLWSQGYGFIMPRLGIAFRPTDKWVVRAGGGWFDEIQHLNNWTILNLMPPKSGSLQYSAVTDIAQTLTVTGADGNPYTIRTRNYRAGQPVLSFNDPFLQLSGGAATSRPINVLHAKPDEQDGNVWKWSFDIQRELPFNTALTIGYVGTKGTHTGNSIGNWNDAPPSSDTNIQARRPFQQYYDPALPQLGVQTIGTIRYLDSYGNSFYHGLQVSLDKRFSRGLAFGIAYTYSKAHGDGEAGGNEGASYQDPRNNRRASRGLFNFNQTQAFVAHYVWEMPGGHLAGPLKYVIGGWQTNGILTLRSGFPLNLTQGGDLNTGTSPRPDRIADGRLDSANRQLWFDPNAFRRVTCNIPGRQDLCHFGTSGYNVMTTPAQHVLNFALFKNFPVHGERVKLQFRSEFFNAFNTPQFGAPNGIGFSTNDSLVPDAARMGEIRGLRIPMRIIQFGLKLSF